MQSSYEEHCSGKHFGAVEIYYQTEKNISKLRTVPKDLLHVASPLTHLLALPWLIGVKVMTEPCFQVF
jgi:hypothetical protein